MKIITSEKSTRTKLKEKELIPVVISRIFAICKEDKNFTIKQEIEDIDKRLIGLKRKTLKQDALLEQSSVLEKDVSNKLKSLDTEIFSTRARLLELLGSEL